MVEVAPEEGKRCVECSGSGGECGVDGRAPGVPGRCGTSLAPPILGEACVGRGEPAAASAMGATGATGTGTGVGE